MSLAAFADESKQEIVKKALALKGRMANMAVKAERSIDAALTVVEVGGVGFGMGYINGRYGVLPANATKNTLPEFDVAGVPFDLAGGLALTALSMLGGLGAKYEEHGVRVGAAMLGAYGYRTGYQMGAAAYTTSAGAQSRTTTVTSGRGGGRMGEGDQVRLRTGDRQTAGAR